MRKIEEAVSKIETPDITLKEKAKRKLDSLTKPPGSLGKLEELAQDFVLMTGKETPCIKNKAIFTLAADHGVAEEGISAFPKEVTPQMVYNFLKGGAAINVLAKHAGARIIVADAGVAEDFKPEPGLKIKKVNRGTGNIAKGPAMTREEAVAAVENGIELFHEELGRGIDIAGTGEMGIGNTTPSSAITAVITKMPVAEVTGRGTGIDEKTLPHKIQVIKNAIRINNPDPEDGLDILSKVGGFEIGGLAGIFLAAAANRIPAVIDGFISGAAALIAQKIEPKAAHYMFAGHSSVEKGHKAALDHLGLEPILDLRMRLGEGTGAALAISVIEAGIKIFTQMATFESAGVSGKS